MKFGKLGLGFGSGNFNNRPPYYTLLNQLLKGNIIPATGVIADSIGNYPAQIVEQPCGVCDGASWTNVPTPVIPNGGNTFTASVKFIITGGEDTRRVPMESTGTYSISVEVSSSNTIIIYTRLGTGELVSAGGGAVSLNTEYEVTTRFTGTAIQCYVNGIFVAEETFAQNEYGNTLGLNIGRYRSADRYFIGKVWDVAIWHTVEDPANLDFSTADYFCPDPSTGFDVSGNGLHATNNGLTLGTQDESFYFQQYGFDRYTLKETPFTVIDVPKTIAGSAIDVSATYPSSTHDHVSHPAGYIVPMGAVDFKPIDGENKVINPGFDSDSNWTMNDGTVINAGIVTFPANNTKYPGLLQTINIVNGNYYKIIYEILSNTLTGDNDFRMSSSSSFGSLSIPNTVGVWSVTVQAVNNNNTLKFIIDDDATGGSLTLDDVGLIDILDTELEVYNRYNIIDADTEYWKEEIQLIESFNPTYPWRHDLDEFGIDYIRIFGTALLIQRLFMRELLSGDDPISNSYILNYLSVRSAAERQLIYNHLKEPTKSILEAWEQFQASGIIAAYRFDKSLSLFDDDGSLAIIGDSVSKIIDVGSGNGDGKTYHYLTQSTAGMQANRISDGLDFVDATREYDIDSLMNGNECYIEEMDGTFTAHFTVASSKITAAEIYSQISSYQVKSLKII